MEYDDILFAAWMDDLGVFWGYRPQDPAQLERWDHIPYTIAPDLRVRPFPKAGVGHQYPVLRP